MQVRSYLTFIKCNYYNADNLPFSFINLLWTVNNTLSQIFFDFCNICVSVAVFSNILQNILQYMTKYRDTYTYITEIEKKLGECRVSWNFTF
jgi:hypothetical protein